MNTPTPNNTSAILAYVEQKIQNPDTLKQTYYGLLVSEIINNPLETLDGLFRVRGIDEEKAETAALELIMDHKINPQEKFRSGERSIFGHAIHWRRYRVAEAFSKLNTFDPNHFTEEGPQWTGLYISVISNDIRTANMLLDHPLINPNVICDSRAHRQTTLELVATYEKDTPDIARLIIEHPATDLHTVTKNGVTISTLAKNHKKIWLSEMIEKEIARRNNQ